MEFKNIAVIGAGYVGLSYACLLSEKSNVYLVDKDKEKLLSISSGISRLMMRVLKKNFQNFIKIYKFPIKLIKK